MGNSNRKSSDIAIAFSYVGAVVGAGFISGQELVQFFLQFGIFGFIGWLIVGTCTAYGGYYALGYFSQSKISTFNELTKILYGKKLSIIANIVSLGYLVGGLVIMISGSSTLITELFGANLYLSIFLVSLFIFLNVIGKENRLLNVNRFLIPLLILLMIYVSFKLFSVDSLKQNFIRNQTYKILNPSPLILNWWVSIPLYLGYNTIGAVVAIINMAQSTDKASAKRGGLIGGLLIASMGLLLMLVMGTTYSIWKNSELPFVEVVKNHNASLYLAFAPSMLIAMYTVAVHYMLGLSKFLDSYTKSKFSHTSAIVLAILFPISALGFSKLIGIIYPFFGLLATFLFLVFLGKIIRNKMSRI